MRALAVGTRWLATLETLKPKDLRNSRLNTDFSLCANTPDFVARVAHHKSTSSPPTNNGSDNGKAKSKKQDQPAGSDGVESLCFVQLAQSVQDAPT
jgi:hypothetical protein